MRIILVIGAIVAALVLANAVSASAEVTHSASPSDVPPDKCELNINGNSTLTDNADCEQLANSLVDKVGSLLQGL